MMKGCRIWAYTMLSLAFMSLLFYTSFLVRARLEDTGNLLLNVLDTFLVCLQWAIIGTTVCGILLLMALVVRTLTHRQTANIGQYGTITRWGFGQRITVHAPFIAPQLQKEIPRNEIQRPSNEKSVYLVPAHVRPGRSEPDAEEFEPEPDSRYASPLDAGFYSMDNFSSPLSVADDMLEVAYTAILGGVRGRRALAKHLNTTEHMAISLIERLKGQGKLNKRGAPVNETKTLRP